MHLYCSVVCVSVASAENVAESERINGRIVGGTINQSMKMLTNQMKEII